MGEGKKKHKVSAAIPQTEQKYYKQAVNVTNRQELQLLSQQGHGGTRLQRRWMASAVLGSNTSKVGRGWRGS